MTDYKSYPNLPPSAPPENPQVAYHLSVIQAKMQGLKNKEQMLTLKHWAFLSRCSTGGGGGCFPPPFHNSFVFKVRLVKFCTEILSDRMNNLR